MQQSTPILASVLVAFASTAASAQTRHLELLGGTGDDFGAAVAGAGDVNQDGYGDFLVGARQPGTGPGYARVYSGLDGALLHHVVGAPGDDAFGAQVAGGGHLDGDGVPDFVVAAPQSANGGYVRAYSGADASLLYDFQAQVPGNRTGDAVELAGDVNGDGYDEILIGAPGHDAGAAGADAGIVYLLDGATGTLVASQSGTLAGAELGADLVTGDFDGDQVPDYGASARPLGVRTLRLYSGATHAELNAILYSPANDGRVDGVGDVNDDGRDEVGANDVYSVDGTVVVDFASTLPTGPVGGGGDFDGDGTVDVIRGGGLLSSYVGTFAGGTDTVLSQAGYRFEVTAGIGDVNGDGYDDWAAGHPNLASFPGGRVVVFLGGPPAPIEWYCPNPPSSTVFPVRMEFAGSNSVSENDLVLFANGAPAGQFGVFFYGADSTMMPFGDGLLCVGGPGAIVIRLDPPVQISSAFNGTAFALDYTQPPMNAGAGLVAPGSTRYFQFWFRDPAAGGSGFDLSDALAVSFVP